VKRFVNAANLITTASLAAGFAAVLMIGEGHLTLAVSAVGLAAVLDSVDGLVARRSSSCGPFGCHLDSLTDLVAFGVAPALILHHTVLQEVPYLGAAACTAFVVAGAWRLARFPLVQDRQHFIGLPIPPAGVITIALALISPPPAIALVICLLLAILMVGSFTVPTFAEVARLLMRRPLVVVDAADDPLDGGRAGQAPGAGGNDAKRDGQPRDDEPVRAPALAGE
jgi:CDP-diacylglycerol---serine O-phosphatidyltransferase